MLAGRGLRAEPARVRAALRRHAGARAPGPARHASRPDEPRRRDRRRGRRLGRLADRRPGARRASSCAWPCSTTCSRRRPEAVARERTRARGAPRRRRRGRPGDLLVRGARVLDPGDGLDARLDVLVARRRDRRDRRRPRGAGGRRGRSTPPAARCCPASSTRTCTCARPAQEHKEDLATGTRGGRRRRLRDVLAMPNTDPVVDTAAGARVAARARRARGAACASASSAPSRSGQRGEQLRRLGELADYGAVGFSDDGRPVLAASLLRRALQYAATTGRVLSLHCEDRRSHARRRHARGRRVRAARPRRLPGDRASRR